MERENDLAFSHNILHAQMASVVTFPFMSALPMCPHMEMLQLNDN